jgi:catechol 2,3-dioxygenase-like lactoylglutathione lyase family enzyme
MPISEIAHVLVLADDIDAARDFYTRTVGLEVGARPPLAFPGYWLYAGGKPCLHIADRTIYRRHAAAIGLPLPAPQGGAHLVDHIAFTATDYEDASARLERDGVEAVRNTVPGVGMRQLFFAGPEGVRIEVNVFAEGSGR